MQAPQVIWIILATLGIGISLAKDGQQKDDKYSFFTSTICTGLVAGLLYWGGFFG